jgi:DNA-binding LacI/PurR family transcriptional regulator
MTTKRPTITDVAQRAGVSKATVSAVLNDRGPVRGATRERVLDVVERLNYRPSQQAARGTARRHRCVALLVKEQDNPYYAGIVAGVRAAAEPRGYALLVLSSEGQGGAERRAVELVHQMDVDGLIATPVLGEHADLSHFFELKRRNFPFVLLEAIRGVPASLVDVDNLEASRVAVEHLIGLGHTRIVHFAGPTYSMHSQERIDGVRRACSASRLAFRDQDVVLAGANLADGHRAALAYFGAHPPGERPTAVTCYNDLVAVGVCRALRTLGLRVPDDVSVVGFDDLPLVEYLDIPLTTVHVPTGDMGAGAADLLMRQIEVRESFAPRKVVLDAPLVVRASTRAAAGGA